MTKHQSNRLEGFDALRGWVRHIVARKFIAFLGRISFSVYICHFAVLDCLIAVLRAAHLNRAEPLMLPLGFVTAVAIPIGIALISKRAIEDPGIAYGHKLSKLIALGQFGTQLGVTEAPSHATSDAGRTK